MPSGKTHDAITIALAVPTFIVAWQVSGRVSLALATAIAMLIGGMIFGPDLDTHSVETSRWSIFGFLWFPYRSFFSHRSRFTHGLIFGALFRVVYFFGVVTLCAFAIVYLSMMFSKQSPTGILEVAQVWQEIRRYLKETAGDEAIVYAFFGVWLGAASHTILDIIATYIRSGRRDKLF